MFFLTNKKAGLEVNLQIFEVSTFKCLEVNLKYLSNDLFKYGCNYYIKFHSVFMFHQQKLTLNVRDNTWHACHRPMDCGNSGENVWMLPLQLEREQAAGPRSAGSSAGRLANDKKIFIQSSCFDWSSTTCPITCQFAGWRIHNIGCSRPTVFQLSVKPDLRYYYSDTLKSAFSIVPQTYDIRHPMFKKLLVYFLVHIFRWNSDAW